MTKMRAYNMVIGDIQNLLNKNGRNKNGYNAQDHFLSLLQELKQDFKQELSIKFLFNLMDNKKDLKKRRQKLRNLIKGLNTQRHLRFYRDLEVVNYKTEIVEYAHSKKEPFNLLPCELSEEEKQQLQEIKELEEKTGIELKERAKENFKERQRVRNAVYKNGVCVKGVKKQTISKEFIITKKETLKFIEL